MVSEAAWVPATAESKTSQESSNGVDVLRIMDADLFLDVSGVPTLGARASSKVKLLDADAAPVPAAAPPAAAQSPVDSGTPPPPAPPAAAALASTPPDVLPPAPAPHTPHADVVATISPAVASDPSADRSTCPPGSGSTGSGGQSSSVSATDTSSTSSGCAAHPPAPAPKGMTVSPSSPQLSRMGEDGAVIVRDGRKMARRSVSGARKPAASPFAAMSLEYFKSEPYAALTTNSLKGTSARPLTVLFPVALDHYVRQDLTHRVMDVDDTLPEGPGCFARLFGNGPKPLSASLAPQRLKLLALAKVSFGDDDAYNHMVLASIHAAFTGVSSPYPARQGAHWEALGFGGSDPATDIRGAGVFGLLQLFYLYHHNPANAAVLYRLSRRPNNGFPLALMSLNVSKWVVQMARQGQLSGVANQCNSMYEAAQRVYVGAMYDFHNTWRREGKTMAEASFVLKALEVRTKAHPADMAKGAAQTLA